MFNLVGPLYLVLWLVEFGLVVWALGDSLMHKPGAYVAAGKLTKTKWNAILGLALLFVLLTLLTPTSLIGIAAVIAAAVYLADVRPAVREYRGGRGGGSGRMGPYGPW